MFRLHLVQEDPHELPSVLLFGRLGIHLRESVDELCVSTVQVIWVCITDGQLLEHILQVEQRFFIWPRAQVLLEIEF